MFAGIGGQSHGGPGHRALGRENRGHGRESAFPGQGGGSANSIGQPAGAQVVDAPAEPEHGERLAERFEVAVARAVAINDDRADVVDPQAADRDRAQIDAESTGTA